MSFTKFYNEKTPFQAIKTKDSKSGKTGFFAKGLTHGVGPKMAVFPTIFYNERKPFQAIKTKS